jgi:ATP-dependent helicase HepA
MTLEQRIGRLDRIGRQQPVEIVYFRPPGGLGAAVARLYEELGIFREPLGGLGRELAGVRTAVEEAALSGNTRFESGIFTDVIRNAREARDRVQAAAHHELHRDPYRPEMEDSVLARVPPDLDDFTEEVLLACCERVGLSVEKQRGRATYSVEFGNQAVVESLPGVPGGSNYLGTFDRLEGVENETIDFYASGHPLVEGLLSHMEESPYGRVALLHVRGGGEEGLGILSIYRDGPHFEAVAVDLHGNERPDWAEILTRRPVRSRRVKPEAWTRQPGWPTLIRNLAKRIRRPGQLVAVAAFRTGG